MDDHQNSKPIYTDASKTNNGVGLSTISNNLKSLHKFPLDASIFTTESLATYKTIEHIHNNTKNPHTNYIILSDSLGSFNACFNSTQNPTDVIKLIQGRTYRAADKGKQIHFLWIQGHIARNEEPIKKHFKQPSQQEYF